MAKYTGEVICIHKGPWPSFDFTGMPIDDVGPNPSYMESVTVVGWRKICNQPCYRLSEYLFGDDGSEIWYETKYFAIPSDISELTEIIQQQPETV